MSQDKLSKAANLSPAKQALLERMRKRAALTVVPVIQPRTSRKTVPLSFAQQRMWVIQQLDPASYLYNEPRALQIQGQVNVGALERALNSIIERHEILRTTFPEDENGQPWQRISPELRITLPVTDLSSAPGKEREEKLRSLMFGFGRQTFGLAQGPLLRAHLFRLADDDHVLAMSFHHVISDGWTGGIVFRELGEFYQAHLRGDAPRLPELPVQYADYAIWQREWMQGPVLESELKFWRKHLEGAPASIDLPTDRARPESLNYDGDCRSVWLGEELSNRLKSLCQAEATTLFPAMLAGLNILLARWTGQQDLIVGTVSANRDQTEIENLIGCFTNFLPLRARLASDESALDFLRRTKQNVLGGFAHQNCPFEKIIEAVRPQRSLNINPLYHVSLQVQNYPEMAFRTDVLEARLLRFDLGVAFLDLRFVAEERAGGISIDCEYNQHLFDRRTIEHLLRGYVSVLEQLTLRPQVRIAEIVLPHALVEQAVAARRREQKQTITVTSTFTAEPVASSLLFWMKELGIHAEMVFAPYNQMFQQLLDPSSLVSRNADGINIVLVRMSDWQRFEEAASEAAAKQEIARNVNELVSALQTAAQRSPAPILLGVCPPAQKLAARPGWTEFFTRMEQVLLSELDMPPRVDVITSAQTLNLYSVENYEDEYADKLGHIPYTPPFFIALGSTLARRMFSLWSAPRRVIVLDCDNTLWKGVCDEDGPLGVLVDAPYRALQEFMLHQIDAGMLLCLCGKNAEADVEAVFAENSGMVLRDEHIAARRMNWNSKPQNLAELADELQIGLDSFVFIGGGRAECAEVQAQCPEVLTLLLPENAEEIPSFLRGLWVFDHRKVTPEDVLRAATANSEIAAQNRLLARIAAELRDVRGISRAVELERVGRRQLQGAFVAPRTPIEEMVAAAWLQLLSVDRVSVHDDFFALGGHSLLATQVIARVRQTLSVELPLRAMFEAPTIAEFALRIENARRSGDELQAPPIIRLAKRDHFPLSFAQQRLWFLDQLEPGNPIYNIPQMFRMRGTLDGTSLQRALNKVVERHESLRTSFALSNGEPVQVIAPKLELHLPILDLSQLPDQKRDAEIHKLASDEARRPFNLSSGPLLRAQLLHLGTEEHVLLLTMHHIISDRWSLGVLSDELAGHYAAFAEDKPSPFPALTVQYPDFAAWQREWLQGEILTRQLGYWKEQLAGAPQVLELPADHTRPPVMTPRGATQSVIVPRVLVEKLTALSRSEGVTLFMTLLAAFQTLLSRYSGQEDVVVGSPIANRNFAEVEPLIGFFVNMLALRGDLSGDPSFRELMAQAKEVCLEAYAHQDIPFAKLVEELQPERSLAHNPIFQVMFALQNAPMQAPDLPGLKLERMPVHTGTSMFDMSWFAIEAPEGLMIRAEYSTDLFEDDTITRALGHFETLLQGIAQQPDCQISKLPLLTENERRQVICDFNSTSADYPLGLCLHQFFETQVERTPEATALICEQQRLTYRELNERANQLASYLRKLGVGPDDLVGVCAHRSVEMVVGLYGIMKAGGAYVPLDPDYPRQRLAMMLEDAQPKVLLTQERLLSILPPYSGRVFCLDRDWQHVAVEPADNPPLVTNGKNLAYAIYTSGSTGKPKGVPNVHEGIVNRLLWMQETYRLTADDRVLQKTPYSFDVSVWEFFWPLITGASLVVARPEGHKDPAYLVDIIARERITTLHFVPSMLQIFLQAEGLNRCHALRRVFCSGEALPYEVQQKFFELCSAELHNLYGPTEAAVDVTYWGCRADYSRALVPIGRPIANTQIYLLDKSLQPVPIGIAGELHIGGVGLARGYLNRPDLTSEKFICDPFSNKSGARLYKTGDLARFLPDGNIEYLGRIDHQVKIRGFRIELGEIEAALDRHPEVRQSVVLAREDQPGNKRLVGYILPEGTAPAVEDLRTHLSTSLPEFMVPSAFVMMQSFPLSANGKVNRNALPVPEYGRPEEHIYIAPRNETEERIAAIWSQVLHVPVGANDDFFALGGHSLLAAQVISRLRQAFDVEIPLKAMFESPKLESLAARIQAAKRGSEIPAITRVSREKPLPASFAQQRLWFLDQLEPNNPVYNIPWTLKINGEVNAEAIENGLNVIAARHESLRTRFDTVADQPVQIIHDSARVPLRKIDLSGIPQHEREAEARRLIAADANRSFDLTQAPLLRAMLLRLSDDEHYLLINIHHIISDRWSMGVLSQELATLYQATIEGRTAQLPELPLQCADYTAWQHEWLRGEVLEELLAYWKEHLKDAPQVLELPTDRPRPATESFRGEVASLSLSRELSDKLNQLSRKHRATLFMTLLAGFQALLSRYSGQDDIVVGTAIANRNQPELENVIGFFVNTLPLRTNLAGDPSFGEIISRAKETALGAYAHQDMPFEKLVEELRPERSLSHSPLVQVFFALQNAPVEALQLRGLRLKPVPSGIKTVKGDMYLSMIETPEGLEGRLEYSTDLFDRATVERMLGHFRVLLEAAVADPTQKLSDLPLLTVPEWKQVVVQWNDTHVEYPRALCLHQLIEQQVEKTPNAPALVFESEQLTYRALNARANQLAHRLRGMRVGPEVLAGICAERSIEMVVGLLAVLKSGGAYVPLDPDHPRKRLAMVLEDAAPAVLLTQRRLLEVLPDHKIPVICLDRDWQTVANEPETNPPCLTNGKDQAYAIFTSGSTGKPKGVPNVHEGIVNRLLWMQHAYQLEGSDRVLQKTPYSFDVSVWEFFWPLMTGACLVVARPEGHKDPNYLIDLIIRQKITTMHFVPSMLRIFLEADGVEQCTSLRRVVCSGEALPFEVQQRFFQRLGAELHNLYGPTEASVDVTYWQCHAESERSIVPIGRPIWNTQIYILDKRLQPVPIGVPGELHIAGVGLARGYLNRPQLTAEKFIFNPFGKEPGARLYRTGDLCRWWADGNIEYLGRMDHQVKLRGFRIELGEIESALAQHPTVRQTIVVVREDTPGDKRLVAYVVPQAGAHLTMAEGREHLKKSLPDYMVPAAIVELDQLPLTTSGKVDRKRLPAPDYGTTGSTRDAKTARTLTEEIIAGIWAEVLKLQQVGVEDDFFDLGGHSLLATQLVSRIKLAFKTELPLRTLFESPTVAGLARQVEALTRQECGLEAPPLRPVPRDRPLPLSFPQQRLWFLDQLEPGNPLYNVSYITRMKGPLDVEALEKSLNEIVRRHESLRTSFATMNDQPVQIIAKHAQVELAVVDVSHLPTLEMCEAEARKLASEEIQKPFNLATGPLLRPGLIKIASDDHALILMMHHIITDRWSLGVLSQELATLYEANLEGKPSSLPELGIQYADYAVWQREFLSGKVLEKQLAYWRQQLEGAPAVLELPTDRPRKEREHFGGAQHRQEMPGELVRDLRTFSRSQRGTFFMSLVAGFQLLLARLSGQDDIVIGTDLANRNQLETERLIGFFVNLLPMRVRLDREASFTDFFQQVREISLEAMAHQDLPFDKLVEELRPERSLSHNPLVQVLFVMQNTPQIVREFGGLKLGPLGVGSSSRFDLVVFINNPEDDPSAMWMYNPNLFEANTIVRVANQYERLLRKVCEDPGIRLESLFVALDEAERQQRGSEQKKFQEAGLEKLRKIRRKAIEA